MKSVPGFKAVILREHCHSANEVNEQTVVQANENCLPLMFLVNLSFANETSTFNFITSIALGINYMECTLSMLGK